MPGAPSPLSSKFLRFVVFGSVVGTVLTLLITGWWEWEGAAWAVLLNIAVAAWLVALWRSAHPDRLGAVCTVPALSPVLIGGFQLTGLELSMGVVVWAVAVAALVGMTRLVWERCQRPRRMSRLIDLLHTFDPVFARSLSWMSTHAEPVGLSQKVPAREREQVQERAYEMLCGAGAGQVTTVSNDMSVRIEGRVSGIPVILELRWAPEDVRSRQGAR
ncbi:hypothetical protein [Nocardiopsis alba]